jgi:cytochrome c oxidase subunit 2
MPIDASAHGPALDSLTVWVHWVMAILFVGWGAYFIYVLIRFRAGANPKASYHGAHSHFSSYTEAAVAVVEVVLLVGFAIPAWSMWVTPPAGDDVFEVRVIGQQFQWNVHYPGPDGVFGRTDINLVDDAIGNNIGLDRSDPAARDDVFLINNLNLPVDRDILIHLTSRDVIHSFALPQMRVKQDAIPGMMVPVHFRPVMTTPADARTPGCQPPVVKTCWEIACAQLCGLGHYRMQGFYQILPQAEFDDWMAQQQATLAASLPPLDAAAAPLANADGAPAVAPTEQAGAHAEHSSGGSESGS